MGQQDDDKEQPRDSLLAFFQRSPLRGIELDLERPYETEFLPGVDFSDFE